MNIFCVVVCHCRWRPGDVSAFILSCEYLSVISQSCLIKENHFHEGHLKKICDGLGKDIRVTYRSIKTQ